MTQTTEKDKKDFIYIPVFIYFIWLIAIQGHRRAGGLSQHAVSERQRDTLDTALVDHTANKETDKHYHTYGNSDA